MGIPKFFRWLTRRYPMILQGIKREEEVPPTDILYLDLNGIVHNCIHGNDSKRHERVSQLGDFEEVWANIMKAIDEIVHTIKPRSVLFLAVDGVAPRAKMNQQRARRFRSAKDAAMLRQQLESEGKQAPELFDSNAISPGTNFMAELSRQLDFFVQYKLNTDPLYQKLVKVILSDSSVPGEGEHKMMDYVRQAKMDPNYDPNTRHCFYGADADLIMLSLITHEPNFFILREEHIVKKTKQGGVQRLDLQRTQNFQLIHISLLREYLFLEYSEIAPQMKMRFDLERIIDDFVFFCFFIGNDFLPSLSALDISEGSLDYLIDFYKSCLPSMSDYITEAGKVHWDRAQPFIQLLGEHEHEVFKNRIHNLDRERERVVSWDQDFGQARTANSTKDKASLLKFKVQEKLLEKKRLKVQALTLKKSDKQFKKYLLMKRFAEDDDKALMTPVQTKQREDLILKYRNIRDKQYESQNETVLKDKKKDETLTDIINGIKDDYFSDLQPNEIPDEHVSDVNENEIVIPEGDDNPELESKIAVQNSITDKYEKQNEEFMREFVRQYAQDADAAKASYYQKKVGFEGFSEKAQMLKKYLEGLQWVLYYYYKGVQHWRWYYPYHYAPMISDLGDNVVKNFLGGKVVIEEFETDYNCSSNNKPYTPFQQLLSILPTKSIHLLPGEYKVLATGILEKYFPADFDIDLNGRTLPWEAICLIPFVDDTLFLDTENKVKHGEMEKVDKDRNQITFAYKSYKYDKQSFQGKKSPLPSTLTSFNGLPYNYVLQTFCDEYKDVGKHSFASKLHPNVQQPCYDFPSFKWLNVNSFEYDTKVINGVPMKRMLVKVPSCMEEQHTDELERFIHKFLSSTQKELYVNFPYLNEAFPTVFEDQDYVYQIYGDAYTGHYRVHKQPQNMTHEEFDSFATRQKFKLQDKGISVQDPKAFVIVNKVTDVQYDSNQGVYYKIFSEDSERLPFSLTVKRRDADHYQNVNQRVSAYHQSLRPGKEVVCLNQGLFGILGELNKVDARKDQVKVNFDKETEESKIHDPFMGQYVLQKRDAQDLKEQDRQRRFFTDQQIEKDLKLSGGVVNRLTGSFLVSFIDRESGERQVFDLGLNIKNYTKKVHIPDYVRFVAEDDSLAEHQFDTYEHNYHARGAKHIKKHWEYSQDCFDIIKEYFTKYKEIPYCIARTMRDNRQMNTLKDIFKGVDQDEATAKVKEIARWIEGLPISNLPYVEMGFDALATDLIAKLDDHKSVVKADYQPIQLNVKESELLQLHMVYQECFPFWSPPYQPKRVEEFKVGDRVMNICSTKREYVPFGLRGTVVGKTNEKVIVLFDEQYLNGSNIYGHCKDYKGGTLMPANLLNLTKKFSNLLRKNAKLVEQFQEQPVGGRQEEEKKDYEEVRQRVVSYQNPDQPQKEIGTRKERPQQQIPQPSQPREPKEREPRNQKQFQPKGQQQQYAPKQEQKTYQARQPAPQQHDQQVYQPKQHPQQDQQVYQPKQQQEKVYQPKAPQAQTQPQTQTEPPKQTAFSTNVPEFRPKPKVPEFVSTSNVPDYVPAVAQPHEAQDEAIIPQQEGQGFDVLQQISSLAQNNDFQQLMSMMNLAQQMQGFQLFNPAEGGQNLDVNANTFVPQQKKEE